MSKGALSTIAAILGVCFSLSAQEKRISSSIQPANFALSQASPREMVEGRVALKGMGNFRTLNNTWYGSGPLTLADGRLFSFPRAFGWVEAMPSDFLPAFMTQALPRVTPVTILPGDTDSKALDLPHEFDYVGGEVSVFYGRSIGGKSKREVVQGSFLSEVVDGNTHIIMGGSYGHSSGHVPRPTGW
jgi:hypothetical protein